MDIDTRSYVTVYKPVAGWKAILVWFNPEGFWEPWQTGYFAWNTREEAVLDAKAMAYMEGIEYKDCGF